MVLNSRRPAPLERVQKGMLWSQRDFLIVRQRVAKRDGGALSLRKNAMTENEIYTVADAARLTGLSAKIITRLFEREPGVMVYKVPNPKRKRRSYRSIRIPRRLFERVMRRHTVQ